MISIHTLIQRKLATFLLVLIVAGASLAKTQSPKTAKHADIVVAEARLLWQSGQKSEAIEKIKAAIELSPKSTELLMELAGMYMELGKTEKAREAVAAAVAVKADQYAVNRLTYSAISRGNANEFAALLEFGVNTKVDELLLTVVSQRTPQPVRMVQLLLDRGANVNPNISYKTPLMQAACEGHTEIVKLLLAKGAQVNVKTDESQALIQAVWGGHPEIVKLLLAAGADVNAKNRLDYTALISAAGKNFREMNPPKGAPPVIPDPEILRILLVANADPNIPGNWGKTALMEANSAVKINLLIAGGADVNLKDKEGRTALMHGVSRGDGDVVEALVRAGADTTLRDNSGATALMHAFKEESSYSVAETERLTKRRLDSAKPLLMSDMGDINAQAETGETLLMKAVNLGSTEIVKLLLARGADINKSDILDNTALVIAYEKNLTEIEGLLKTNGLQPLTKNGLNAFLRAAIGKSDAQKVRELLAAGANPNYEYAIGHRHLDIKTNVLISAVQVGDVGIVKQLVAAGASVTAKGLLHGSEHELVYGTALEAAQESKNSEMVEILKRAAK